MVPENPGEDEIFDAASQLTPGPRRSAYLDRACLGDRGLRQRIDDMLKVAGAAEAFFASQLDDSTRHPNGVTSQQEPGSSLGRAVHGGLPDLSAGTWIGDYCLGKRIGEGGFGDVYVATQTKPVRRQVALKILKPGMDSRQVLARFGLERQALALMDHPAITRVLDAGTAENGRPFFVMDLIHGRPITEYCDQRGLGIEARLGLFVCVCQAIQHAHQKGVIHRDIKPSNILVSEQDGAPTPKVIDFGIAKATEEDLALGTVLTRGGQVLGTPAYMSPEQAGLDGLDIDTRSDVYALGVLLHELLVGSPPFETSELLRAGMDEMRRILREREPLRPSTRLARLDAQDQAARGERRGCEVPHLLRSMRGDLDWIVMKCLEKDRARRYATVNALSTDIERFLNHEPVVARPPSAGYRTMKALRRNRGLVTAAGVVLAVLLGAVALTSWQAREATRAKEAVLRANAALEKETDNARAAQALAEAERWATIRQVYPRLMLQAQQAWNQADYDRLQGLLEEAKSSPDRGFEWFHWERALHLEEVTLQAHATGGARVVYRPDGQRLATAGNDGTIAIWNPSDGRQWLRFHAHDAGVTALDYTPDGRWLLTGSDDRTLRLWDAETGRLRRIVGQDSLGVALAALAPDGRRVVSVAAQRSLKVWELTEDQEPRTLGPFAADLSAAAFFPDSRRIALGGSDGTVWFVDVDTAQEVFAPIKGHAAVVALVVHPDGRRVAVADGNHIIHLMEPAAGIELRQMTAHGRDGRIRVLSLSEDGRRLLSASVQRTVRVWDFDTGEVLSTLRGLTGLIESGAISPNGQQVAIGGADGRVRLWGASGGPYHRPLQGHPARVTALAFTADAGWLVSGGEDGSLKAWEVLTGREVWTVAENASGTEAVAVFPGDTRVVSGGGEGTLGIRDLRTGERLHSLVGHSNSVTALTVSPDGEQVCSGSADGEVRLWNASTGEMEGTWVAHASGVRSIGYLPKGGQLVSAGTDGRVKLWDVTTRRLRKQFYTRSEALKRPTPSSYDTDVRTENQGLESEFVATVSPDGKSVAASYQFLQFRLWETASGRPQLDFTGSRTAPSVFAFSPDGNRLITGEGLLRPKSPGHETLTGSRGALRLWDTATGREMLTLWPHKTGVSAAAFSPNGRWLASGGEDGSIWVYGSAPGAAKKQETPDARPVQPIE